MPFPVHTPERRSIYWQWVLHCTLGELIGFGGIPVLGGLAVFSVTTSLEPALRSLVLYAVAVTGGLGEGAVLAWFQLRILRRMLPQLRSERWVIATAAAACFAWAVGYLAPTLDELFELSAATQIAIWMPAGVLILLSIGTAQAWVLKEIVSRPSRWVLANAVGWLLGLAWTFVLPALVPADAAIVVWVSAFAVAGVLMGVTVGLVTGIWLLRFL